MIEGYFVHLDETTLTTMLAQWQACLTAIALNQSYSIAGRSFSRANLADVSKTLAEISYALNLKAGTLARFTQADMSYGP